MSSLEYQENYKVKTLSNPLTNEKLLTDLITKKTTIENLPVPVQLKYSQTLSELDSFLRDKCP